MSENDNRVTERQILTIQHLRTKHPELKSSSDEEIFAYILKNTQKGVVYKGFENLEQSTDGSETPTAQNNAPKQNSVFKSKQKADYSPQFGKNKKAQQSKETGQKETLTIDGKQETVIKQYQEDKNIYTKLLSSDGSKQDAKIRDIYEDGKLKETQIYSGYHKDSNGEYFDKVV